jgi:hypothetical protein
VPGTRSGGSGVLVKKQMNKLAAIVFLILLFPIPVSLFSQEEQSHDKLINQINELYESIEDNEVWEQQTANR